MKSGGDTERCIFRSSEPYVMLVVPWQLDARALAVSRMALAAVTLYDLGDRVWYGFFEHYADVGAYPREALLKQIPNVWIKDWPNIYMSTGSSVLLSAIFLLHACVAICMLVGYRSRLSTAATWYFTSSLIERNGTITHSGDSLLRIVLFWSIFVPLGRTLSVDAALAAGLNDPVPPASRVKGQRAWTVSSAGTFALVGQASILYFFSARR